MADDPRDTAIWGDSLWGEPLWSSPWAAIIDQRKMTPSPNQINWPEFDARVYTFVLINGQHFTGDLSSAGAKTITINAGSRTPAGLSGTNANHYLRISGGTGTAETVLVTGGTAISGSVNSGTLTFTTAHSHTGNFTITSATAGMQEAMYDIPETGGVIRVAEGVHTMYGPVSKRAIPAFIRGVGEDATTFKVDPGFPVGALGVFSVPDDTDVCDAANLTSGGFGDFTVSFTQPDSADIGTYTEWPPAIYGKKTSRLLIERVKGTACWDFITIEGESGPTIQDCKASFFRRGVSLSSILDSSRVENFHGRVFGLTFNQTMVMLYGSSPQTFWIGRADDAKILNAATSANFGTFYNQTTGDLTGTPWAEVVSADMAAGGLSVAAGRVHVVGGTIGATSNATYRPAQKCITYTGGELTVTDAWMLSETANTASCLIDLDFSTSGTATDQLDYVRFHGCRVEWRKDAKFIYAHTTSTNHGTVILTSNRFRNAAAVDVAITNPVIRAEGYAKVILAGNSANDKFSAAGNIFSSDSDMGHVVTGNSFPNWSIGYSTLNATWGVAGNSGILNPVPVGSPVASASSVSPSGRVFHVTGTAAIATIVPLATMGSSAAVLARLTIIPDGVFTWGTSGNIAVAGTAVVARPLELVWDTGVSKWYPSYV